MLDVGMEVSCGIREPVNLRQRVHWHVAFYARVDRGQWNKMDCCGSLVSQLTLEGGHSALGGKEMVYLMAPHKQPPEIEDGRSGEVMLRLTLRITNREDTVQGDR